MISAERIHHTARALAHRYGSTDPKTIAEGENILILYSAEFTDLLGTYLYHWDHAIVLLNARMDEDTERMVLAHELGHHMLHRELAQTTGLTETSLTHLETSTEYEANALAAHLLLGDDEIREYARDYRYDPYQIASLAHVNAQLVLVKFQEMNRMGAHFRLPESVNSRFFRTDVVRSENNISV